MLMMLLFLSKINVSILNFMVDKFSVVSAARVNWRKSEALAAGECCEGLPCSPSKPNLKERRVKVSRYLSREQRGEKEKL